MAAWLITRSIITAMPRFAVALVKLLSSLSGGAAVGGEQRMQAMEVLDRVEAAGEARIVERVDVDPVEAHRRDAVQVVRPGRDGAGQQREQVVNARTWHGRGDLSSGLPGNLAGCAPLTTCAPARPAAIAPALRASTRTERARFRKTGHDRLTLSLRGARSRRWRGLYGGRRRRRWPAPAIAPAALPPTGWLRHCHGPVASREQSSLRAFLDEIPTVRYTGLARAARGPRRGQRPVRWRSNPNEPKKSRKNQ